MATELSDQYDRPSPDLPRGNGRRERLERELVTQIRSMASYRLTEADGVRRAADALVVALREEGLRCEQVLLAIKALVTRTADQPHVLTDELVPRCISHYYRKSSS